MSLLVPGATLESGCGTVCRKAGTGQGKGKKTSTSKLLEFGIRGLLQASGLLDLICPVDGEHLLLTQLTSLEIFKTEDRTVIATRSWKIWLSGEKKKNFFFWSYHRCLSAKQVVASMFQGINHEL